MTQWTRGMLLGMGLLLAAHPAVADARKDANRRKFYAMRKEALIESGNNIAKVGIWCRDAGMTAAASQEFLRAVEVSEGQNPWAARIVAIMRGLGDKFWRKKLKRVSPGMMRAHRKRSEKAHRNYVLQRLRLAKWAHGKGLTQEALLEYEQLADLQDEPLEKNAKGEFVIEGKSIPAEYSKKLEERAVQVANRWYLRSGMLADINVETLVEVMTPRLRVRMHTTMEEASDLHACLEALYPHLEHELGGTPIRMLNAIVFESRKNWEAWLEANKLSRFRAATGLADAKLNVAAVCAEGLERSVIRGLLMHEFAHLFDYNTSRAIMPSWYREGLAETFGGEGTFRWDGKTLTALHPLSKDQLAPLTGDAFIPLQELLETSAIELINRGSEKAHHFYAQSWALYTWLRDHAPSDVKSDYKLWRTVCRGKALGARENDRRSLDETDATREFSARMGPHLPTIETGLRAWLAELNKK